MAYDNIKGMAELKKALVELPKRVQYNVLRTSIFRGAQTVRDAAKQKLISNGSVRTGKLSRDIKARRSRGTNTEVVAVVEAGTGKGWYARFVEKGHAVKQTTGYEQGRKVRLKPGQAAYSRIRPKRATVGHVPAKPFMVPALEENREKIKQDILKGVSEEIQKAISKLGK